MNSALQGKIDGAGREIGRFAVNTILGGIGFLMSPTVCSAGGRARKTSARPWPLRISSGPYLVLPFYGPSTVRDTFGFAVDSAMNPMNYLLAALDILAIQGGQTVGNAVNTRFTQPGTL